MTVGLLSWCFNTRIVARTRVYVVINYSRIYIEYCLQYTGVHGRRIYATKLDTGPTVCESWSFNIWILEESGLYEIEMSAEKQKAGGGGAKMYDAGR